jgi:polyhydroxyalkanoate synthase
MPDTHFDKAAIITGAPPLPAAPAPVITRVPQPVTPADFDRLYHNWQSRFTGGRSPSTVGLAVLDWATHAVNNPFQTASFGRSAVDQWRRLAQAATGGEAAILPAPGDRRFTNPAWQQLPYNLLVQAVLLGEEWWSGLVRNTPGVAGQNTRMVAFTVRQWLDMISPSNVPFLNPEVIETTRRTGGTNFIDGVGNLLRDRLAAHGGGNTSGFVVGRNVAATPGSVIFRNALMEVIQYAPVTTKVDLSPGNSLIGWLVGQGHTVFVMSWRNPGADMRDTSLDDYRTQGVMTAIEIVSKTCGGQKIHATGYCLGGTLLSIAAAAMAREGDTRLASLSLFAAQTDFTEAGELQLFITEDQLSFLGDIVKTQGYLTSAQMGGAFQMLQSNDLIWSRAIRDYMLGERDTPNDLMAWDADGTRLPARMHIEYLRKLFLDNDLAEGRFMVDGEPLIMSDIKLPVFAVGTERDHIAPWHSVYKLHLQLDDDLTFVLTSGGHNAGIVSEPGHPRRHFRIRTRLAGTNTPGPEAWERDTTSQDGSWWVEWNAWLNRYTTAQVPPPPMGIPGTEPLCAAPGTYVLEA